ncbi:MAG: hypothetical protein AAFY76_17855, partial [Cyanobacteria bacterium J06649_11]
AEVTGVSSIFRCQHHHLQSTALDAPLAQFPLPLLCSTQRYLGQMARQNAVAHWQQCLASGM